VEEKVTAEKALAVSVRQLAVASALLVKEYENVHRTGQFDDPQLAAAALREVDQMVTSLMVAGLDRVRYDGSHVKMLLDMGDESRVANVQKSDGGGEEK
jgi:hypothetical protein